MKRLVSRRASARPATGPHSPAKARLCRHSTFAASRSLRDRVARAYARAAARDDAEAGEAPGKDEKLPDQGMQFHSEYTLWAWLGKPDSLPNKPKDRLETPAGLSRACCVFGRVRCNAARHFARLRHRSAQVHSRHHRQQRFWPWAHGSHTDLGSCTVIIRSDTTGAAFNPLIATAPAWLSPTNSVYLPQEVLLASTHLASRQINAIRYRESPTR